MPDGCPDGARGLVSAAQHEDGVRGVPVKRKAVAFIDESLFRAGENIVVTDDFSEFLEQLRFQKSPG
jgi:hypothetical protein